jgi:hypothetical protein
LFITPAFPEKPVSGFSIVPRKSGYGPGGLRPEKVLDIQQHSETCAEETPCPGFADNPTGYNE